MPREGFPPLAVRASDPDAVEETQQFQGVEVGLVDAGDAG
jgi:hypothetical protein